MPVFGHGDLRLYLLHALDEKPRHGYELIRLLEDRFVGLYTPSAGTIYPRLAALEEDGLIEHFEEDGRKVYRITATGRDELNRRASDMAALEARVVTSVRDLARDIREDVKASVRDLRREIRESARSVRSEERRSHHAHGDHERVGEWRTELRSIKSDLEAFVNDVLGAARRRDLDADRLRRLRRVLLDARAAILDALADQPPDHSHNEPDSEHAHEPEREPS